MWMGVSNGKAGVASLGMRCTPGGGVVTNCEGGGGSNTGGTTLGGDAGASDTVQCGFIVGAGGTTLGGWCGEVRRVKMALRVLMAANWASPGALNGEFGCGLAMASASCLAAWVASIAGKDVGTAQRWGKNRR